MNMKMREKKYFYKMFHQVSLRGIIKDNAAYGALNIHIFIVNFIIIELYVIIWCSLCLRKTLMALMVVPRLTHLSMCPEVVLVPSGYC